MNFNIFNAEMDNNRALHHSVKAIARASCLRETLESGTT